MELVQGITMGMEETNKGEGRKKEKRKTLNQPINNSTL